MNVASTARHRARPWDRERVWKYPWVSSSPDRGCKPKVLDPVHRLLGTEKDASAVAPWLGHRLHWTNPPVRYRHRWYSHRHRERQTYRCAKPESPSRFRL